MTKAETWKIQVSGYGTFEFVGTETEAHERAKDKQRWEGARSSLVWRADLSTELDRVTAECAELFATHRGVPIKLLKRRAALVRQEKDADR